MPTHPENRLPLGERLHHHLVAPFYAGCAWAYDPLAWLVSGGLWYRWGFTAEAFLGPPPVLEVGCGRGRLLERLARRGVEVIGVDNSPTMAASAQRRLKGARLPGQVLCADARALPLPPASVGTIINVFPTAYVKEPATWAEYGRLLRSGGRWIVVEGPALDRFHSRLLGIYAVALSKAGRCGVRKQACSGIPAELFPRQRRELVPVGTTRVSVWIFER